MTTAEASKLILDASPPGFHFSLTATHSGMSSENLKSESIRYSAQLFYREEPQYFCTGKLSLQDVVREVINFLGNRGR